MKKLLTILSAFFITASVFAQSPEKMSYQAVIRDNNNALVTNKNVGMQISILQGSIDGLAVYVENQTPSTNDNGLVSIEIGAGTFVSGTFSSIEWANGPYFIKTEIDVEGGVNYSIVGTSQLLSVPYALHAKTAETFVGSITESDPVFEASVASEIDEDDIEYWNNKLDSYTESDPVFDASVASEIDEDDIANWNNKLDSYTETDPVFEASVASDIDEDDIEYWNNKQNKLTAGNKIIIEDDVISVDGPAPLALGDSYQGGIIYWLDETGQHGLIVSTEDQSDGIQWRNSVHRYTGAKGNGLYAGKMNTALIIAAQLDDVEDADFAAKLCAEYSVTFKGITYGDWYLPSIYELDLLYAFKAQGGIEIEGIYWSSTEHNKSNARYKNLFSGGGMDIPKSTTYKVRAIRSF